MNKRQKKKFKKGKLRRSMKKFRFEKGDTLVANFDVDAYDFDAILEVATCLHKLTESLGCTYLLLPKEIDAYKLYPEKIEELREIVAEYDRRKANES